MNTRLTARLGIVGMAVALLTAAVVVPLAAQPDFPASPSPGRKDKPGDLIVPPGVYSALVFAYGGGSDSGGVRVTFKTAGGSMTVVIPANDTVVVPMPANFTLGQQGTVVVHAGGDRVSVSGVTPSGPVTFEPAKK